MLTRLRPWFVAVALLGLAACASNTLTGSVSEQFSLAFNKVILLTQPPVLIIEYSNGSEVPCKFTLDTNGLVLKSNTTVSGDDFLKRMQVHRISVDAQDYNTPIGGNIDFTAYSGTPGSTLSGNFTVVFINNGLELDAAFNGPLTSQ